MSEIKEEVAQEVATQERVITVVTSRGEKSKINFTGTKWSELKSLLQKGGTNTEGGKFSGYDLGNMKCVESAKRNTLEHPDAIVPEGSFNLFLMPYKSKSGGMSRSEINEAIKGHIAAHGDKAKEFFSLNGKNYTQVPSSVLEEKLTEFEKGEVGGTSTKKSISKGKAEAVSQVVESVKSSKAVAEVASDDDAELLDEISRMSPGQQIFLVIKLLTGIASKLGVETNLPGAATTVVAEEALPPAKTEEELEAERLEAEEKENARIEAERVEAEKKEKARLQKEEDDKLQAEMREMAGGFNDVRL